MAIVIVGVTALIGTIGTMMSSDHSDHSASYSDYSRRRRRRQAEEEARKAREAAEQKKREDARAALDGIIDRHVRSFENSEGVSGVERVSRENCKFESFTLDMKPMDESAKKVISQQVAAELKEDILKDRQRLKELDSLIQAINERMLAQSGSKQKR